MQSRLIKKIKSWGGISLFSGIFLALALSLLIPLPNLRGPQVTAFLAFYLLAAAAYFIAVIRLGKDSLPVGIIWGFAILFRILLLFSEQSLSDDVFRFIWDGNLLRNGINPYVLVVNSPLLDAYEIPSRQFVNHDWMASPYLPAAQLLFVTVTSILPEDILAFQITSVFLDLSIAWLVFDSLKRLSISPAAVLIYLWNPLILSEFANGAHVVDALMILLVMLAFWLMIRAGERSRGLGSALSMAAATLTKGLPGLLVPIFFRRWRWRWLLLYLVIIIAVLAAFALDAGWGLIGPLNGVGVFGALRIYMNQWNFNSSLYHWLEVALSGFPTPGAVPVEAVGQAPVLLARFITSSAIVLVSLLTGWWAWRLDAPHRGHYLTRTLNLIRLSVIPVGAYLLLTHTVHPWYGALIIPFLPFLLPGKGGDSRVKRFIWPWLYLSVAVSLSYLTYRHPGDFRELGFVRQIEYIPVFALLVWAGWPWLSQVLTSIFESGIRWARMKRR